MTELTYTDRNGEMITVEPSTEWINYGEIFVKWDGDMWHIIETHQGEDSKLYFTEYWVEPADLFVNGDPDNGPTEYLKSEIDSLLNVTSYENALVDFDIEYFTVGITHRIHGDTSVVDESEYWDTLEMKGIDREQI